jgi:hypothetical protein
MANVFASSRFGGGQFGASPAGAAQDVAAQLVNTVKQVGGNAPGISGRLVSTSW